MTTVILFDTNVLSEAMRASPNERVALWLMALPSDEPAVTAITIGEIGVGLSLMPPGQKRAAREADWRRVRAALIGERVLPFDDEAAERLGDVVAMRRAAGAPIELADALIASIALARSLTLATRDTEDFEGLGLRLVNPWAK
jgi:predicted nucleic acid-binding protein